MDMINTFEFEGGTALARSALAVAHNIQRLRAAFASADAPVIYCNDNFGQWRSDFRAVYDHCAAPGMRGAEIASLLKPAPDDYFVLKPKHSALYSTPLELLVRSLEAATLVLTGVAGDSCVIATISDAHIRELDSLVVSDAVASIRKTNNDRVLAHVEQAKWAEVATTGHVVRRIGATGRKPSRANEGETD